MIEEGGDISFEASIIGRVSIRNILWMLNIALATSNDNIIVNKSMISSKASRLHLSNVSRVYNNHSVNCVILIIFENSTKIPFPYSSHGINIQIQG